MALSRRGGIPVRDDLDMCAFVELSAADSHYSCRYRPELKLVLKDISMIIVR